MSHTPTPWKSVELGSEGARLFPASGDRREDMKFIAMFNGRDTLTDFANARLVVQAVNSHADLVAALENSLKVMEAVRKVLRMYGDYRMSTQDLIIEQAREALRRAKEEA